MRFFDPFQELAGLQREIDRAFDAARGRGNGSRFTFLPGRGTRNYPYLNLVEDTDNVFIEALAPGVDPESLNVSVQGDQLTISGEKPLPAGGEIKTESFHRNERAAGKFVRSITLPAKIEDTGVEANYKNGILKITLPKSAEAKPRQIAVSVS